MPKPFYLLSFNQIRCGEKREKAQNSLTFLFRFQMENALFLGLHPVVSLRQKRPPSGEERGEKLVAIFEKKKECKGSNFVAQKTSAYIIFFRLHRVIK